MIVTSRPLSPSRPPSSPSGPIKKEELCQVLQGGRLCPEDFLGMTYAAMQQREQQQQQKQQQSTATATTIPRVKLKCLSDVSTLYMMTNPDYIQEDVGMQRMKDGSVVLNIDSDVTSSTNSDTAIITFHMLDFWYRYCDNSEKYREQYPLCHLECSFNHQFAKVPLDERKTGSYINNTRTVSLNFASTKKLYLAYQFDRPSKYFDDSKFVQPNSLQDGITGAVCARLHMYVFGVGWIAIGYFIQLAHHYQRQHHIQTIVFLGHRLRKVDKDFIGLPPFITNPLINNSLFRQRCFSDKFVHKVHSLMQQEVSNLKLFLPQLYHQHCLDRILPPRSRSPTKSATQNRQDVDLHEVTVEQNQEKEEDKSLTNQQQPQQQQQQQQQEVPASTFFEKLKRVDVDSDDEEVENEIEMPITLPTSPPQGRPRQESMFGVEGDGVVE